MLDIFKSKAQKEIEQKKTKEKNRQQKYKRVNVVFKDDEYEVVEMFLKEQNINLTQYLKMKLQEDMSR